MKSSRLTAAGVASLTSLQEQLILGTLFGDGKLNKPALRPRYSAVHGGPQKVYLEHKEAWLDRLSPVDLVYWWMNDGSLGRPAGRFHTEGFTLEEVELLAS